MKKKIFIGLISIIAILGLAIWGILKFPYSKGVRAGRLVKISKKGMILKTYEGTLDLGSGDQLTWQFSTHDSKIGQQLQAASGEYVQLEYVQHLYKVFYDTAYNVVGWKYSVKPGDSLGVLCRLVKILRTDPEVVERLRPRIESMDPQLLEDIRECQARSNR